MGCSQEHAWLLKPADWDRSIYFPGRRTTCSLLWCASAGCDELCCTASYARLWDLRLAAFSGNLRSDSSAFTSDVCVRSLLLPSLQLNALILLPMRSVFFSIDICSA
jgi:hypothetical protein